jgi:hypothetical protein
VGGASQATTLSDIERMEKFMTTCQHANKYIVKYFSKHLNDFRIEQISYRDIIMTDIQDQYVPQNLAN